jgi:hypothetical protein
MELLFNLQPVHTREMKLIPTLVRKPCLLFYLALMLVCLGLAWSEEPIVSVRDVYDGTLSLTTEVNTFRHIDRVFPSATVKHGGPSFPLPRAARQLKNVVFLSAGQLLHLADYLRWYRVAGLLVLQNGQIALERYEFGNTPQTR